MTLDEITAEIDGRRLENKAAAAWVKRSDQ